jgi:hypothetical protein
LGRRITTGITLIVLVGILILGGTWGWKSLFAEVQGGSLFPSDPTPSCMPEKVKAGAKIRSRDVRVSVFNATSRTGLAGETMRALRKRGFRPGDIGNAPSDVKPRKVQVWSTIEDDPAARLVARQFGKNVKVRYADEDLGIGVEVIVGRRYEHLVKAPRSLRVEQKQEYCSPVESPAPLD